MVKRNWKYVSLTITLSVFILASTPNFLVSQIQNFRITHYTTNDGLSQNYVYCILQDSKGFMWFGTRDGLNKFDGYEFKHYKHEPFDETYISHNVVMSIVEDRDGFLWIGTNGGGLNRLDRKTGEFMNFHHDQNNPGSISSEFVSTLYLAHDEKLWIGTFNAGINVFDVHKFNQQVKQNVHSIQEHFTQYQYKAGERNNPSNDLILGITEDRNNNLWFQTNYGIEQYQSTTQTWSHFSLREHGDVYERDSLIRIRSSGTSGTSAIKESIIITSSGEIMASGRGVFRYEHEENIFRRINKQSTLILFEDKLSRVWVGQHGLFVIPRGETQCVSVPLFASGSSAAEVPYIASIAQDYNGSIWVGTSQGVFKLQESVSGFSFIQRHYPADTKDHPVEIRAITENASGDLVLGSAGDWIFRYNAAFNRIDSVECPQNSAAPIFNERFVNSITEIGNGRYWIASRVGMYQWDESRGIVKRLGYTRNDADRIHFGNFFSSLIDRYGMFWVSGARMNKGVLFRYDDAGDSLKPFHDAIANAKRFDCGSGVWKLFETRNHEFWIGTTNGLHKLDRTTNTFIHYKHNPADTNSLSENEIWTIHETNDGMLWLGTLGGGLNSFDRTTNKFRKYTVKDELANNFICCILEDAHGNLWMSTNNGISKFDLRTKVFTNYNNNEIQDVNGFSFGSGLRTRDGKMLFGGIKGLLIFHPDSVRPSIFKPSIVITSCDVLGKNRSSELFDGDTLALRYNENYFSFEFASLDFTNPSKNQYAYQLDGVDKDWVYCGTRRFCSYSNLNPGEYFFHLKGTNSDGIWNEKKLSLFIHVVPPFYMTSWFDWCMGVLILLLIIGLAYWRIDFVHRKELNKRHLIESELHALRLQINPHFFFNSLNAIQSFMMSNLEELANEYISKFAQLMRMVLETSRASSASLSEELKMLGLYLELECIRFKGRFQYRVDIDPVIDMEVRIPPMLLQPYVENAVRHGLQQRGSDGMLTISVSVNQDLLLCVVEDNGIGRERSMELRQRHPTGHTSLGTRITNDRIEVLNNLRKRKLNVKTIDLYDEQRVPAGTRVEISIPME